MFSPLLVLPDPLVNPETIAAVFTLCYLSSEGWNAPKQCFAKVKMPIDHLGELVKMQILIE